MRANIPTALVSAVVSACASILYSIFAIGMVAREITSNELTTIISSTGFLLPLGFAQSGLSGVVVREIIELRNNGQIISDSQKIGTAFIFCAAFSIIIFIIMLINFIFNGTFYIIPVSLLITCGLICSISQSVAVAESKNISNNIFQISSLIICSTMLFISLYFNIKNIDILLIIILGVPSTSSILGFLYFIMRRDFRAMISSFKVRRLPFIWREVLPFSINGGLASLLVAAPTLNIPAFVIPELSADESLFWRFGLFSSNLTVTLAAAILPHLILSARLIENHGPEREVRNYALFMLMLLFLVTLSASLVFIFSPIVIDMWLNRDVYNSPYRLGWSFVIAAWCLVSFLGSAALMSVPTNKIIVCTAVALIALILTTMLAYPKHQLSLTWGYLVAMAAYACCLIAVICNEFRTSNSPSASRI